MGNSIGNSYKDLLFPQGTFGTSRFFFVTGVDRGGIGQDAAALELAAYSRMGPLFTKVYEGNGEGFSGSVLEFLKVSRCVW